MENTFIWIPFYSEMADKLLAYKDNHAALAYIVEKAYELSGQEQPKMENGTFDDVDPFTVFATFNKQLSDAKRLALAKAYKDLLSITASMPTDFEGLPVMNSLNMTFYCFKGERGEQDIDCLWDIFQKALSYAQSPDADKSKAFVEAYDKAAILKRLGGKLTIGLFWIRPFVFVPLDGFSREYLKKHGVFTAYDHFKNKYHPTGKGYMTICDKTLAACRQEEIPFNSIPEMSAKAYEKEENVDAEKTRYWTYSPGEGAKMWQRCQSEGIACIGWDKIGDVKEFDNPEELKAELDRQYGLDAGSRKNEVRALWEFANLMKPGDVIYAKQGRSKLLGRGMVTGDYIHDSSKDSYHHVRKVQWTHVGEWQTPWEVAPKTLTEITNYDYASFETFFSSIASSEATGYWWLNANPKIWRFSDYEVGDTQKYTCYSEKGNKRAIWKHFVDAKPGDLIIGYESTPVKRVVGKAVITEKDDAGFSFRITDKFADGPTYKTIKQCVELMDMEYMHIQQGSLFKLTPAEYAFLDAMLVAPSAVVKESSPEYKPETPKAAEPLPPYTKEDFLAEVYITEAEYDKLACLLERKKNIILQGAPGVGKTFAAKRLAYSMMGVKDEQRVKMIQFHQSYAYEDFIMGYRPNEAGGFELHEGVFYTFCKQASEDSENKYFFIIDEINRGNLGKIFGELFMLIEADKRGEAVNLAYRDEPFSVPENLYLIGMLNTADRSLAMLDYALRRRFSFYTMEPAFNSDGFGKQASMADNPKFDALVKQVKELNECITNEPGLGRGYSIGHSYLCVNGAVTDEELRSIVDYDIVPLLEEYWFDEPDKVSEWKDKLGAAVK